MSNGIFIIGTDTDVGKTVISASLGWKLSKGGKKVCIMKPFATGPEIYSKNFKSEDVSKLVNSINLIESEENINPFFYPLACSPFMASRILNQKPPNLAFALSKFRFLSKKYDYVIIEGIGGLLVPLTRKKKLIDFIKLVGLEVIIVTIAKVGTFNHTLLTINQCTREKIPVRGIIINKMPLKPNIIETQTPSYLQMLTGIPILGIIPEINDLHYNDETFELISKKIDFA